MPATRPNTIPASAGIGLRAGHFEAIDRSRPRIGWLEVHTENYFGAGGVPHHYLRRLREHYPVSFHGVGLSLGSVDPLSRDHLRRIRELVDAYQPGLVSEHLSWGSVDGRYANDLLPYPLTRESLDHFTARVAQFQDVIGHRVLVENPSTYLRFGNAEYTEPGFLNALAGRSGCGILLDVNNVYVSSRNHDFDATAWLDEIDVRHCAEIHLAGHTVNRFDDGALWIDTHDTRVCDDVWSLYAYALRRTGALPTLIEWDTGLPELAVLLDEAAHADRILDRADASAA